MTAGKANMSAGTRSTTRAAWPAQEHGVLCFRPLATAMDLVADGVKASVSTTAVTASPPPQWASPSHAPLDLECMAGRSNDVWVPGGPPDADRHSAAADIDRRVVRQRRGVR